MLKRRQSCFCAFCKISRKVYKHKSLLLAEIFGLIFLGIVITDVVYRSFDPRGLIIVGILLLVGEIFSQLKWRGSMVCQNCGFDAVLYLRDPEQAGLKIKAFLVKRADSPAHLLRPPVVLPSRKADPIKKPAAPPQNLSLRF